MWNLGGTAINSSYCILQWDFFYFWRKKWHTTIKWSKQNGKSIGQRTRLLRQQKMRVRRNSTHSTCSLIHQVKDCTSDIPKDIQQLISPPGWNVRKAITSYTQWVGTLLAYPQNNMPSTQGMTLPLSLMKISQPLRNKSICLVFLTIGIEKSRRRIQIITSGPNGFSNNYTKKAWPTKQKFPLTGAQTWVPLLLTKKLSTARLNVVASQFTVNQCVNGCWKSPLMPIV